MVTPQQREFCDRMLEQLNRCAPVTARAMFGGYGLYSEGVMFALIADETLYFKVDDDNRPDFVNAGMGPFVYLGKHKPVAMSYYQLPEPVLSNPSTLLQWIEKAHAAARRGQQKSPKSRPSKSKERGLNKIE